MRGLEAACARNSTLGGAGAGNQKINSVHILPERDKCLQALDSLQSPDKEKIRILLWAGSGAFPVIIDPLNKVGKMSHRLRKTALSMHVCRKAAGGDELIDMLTGSCQHDPCSARVAAAASP